MSCQTLHLINSELGCFALKQGANFGLIPLSDGMRVFYPEKQGVAGSGDLTGYTIAGQIRTNQADLDSPSPPLASFLCSTPFYQQKVVNGVPVVDANNNPVMGSYFTVRLPAVVNAGATGRSRYLPVPPKANRLPPALDSTTIDAEIAQGTYKIGSHFWVYDIKAFPPNDTVDAINIIDPSLVQVIGGVTDE